MTRAFVQSSAPLAMVMFVLSIVMLATASAMYYVERGKWSAEEGVFIGADGIQSDFQSIPVASYWVIITMATVGYGDGEWRGQKGNGEGEEKQKEP